MELSKADYEQSQILSRLLAWWRGKLEHAADLRSWANLPPEAFDEVARDLAIDRSDLRALVADDRGGALMARMLEAHGLSKQALEAENPAGVREMALVCARCEAKGRCAHELDAGTATAYAESFCPNARDGFRLA